LNNLKRYLKNIYTFSGSWTGTIVIVLFVIFFIAQAFIIPSGSMKNTLLIKDMLFAKKFTYGIPIPRIPWLEIPLLPDIFDNGHLFEGDKPARGDIVIFRFPKNEKIHFVKRCVATGGDEIIYTENKLYLRPKQGDAYIKLHYPKDKIVTLNESLWVESPYQYLKGIHYNTNQLTLNAFELMSISYHRGDELSMKPTYVKELPIMAGTSYNAFYKKVENDMFFMMGDNRDNSNDSRFWGSVSYSYIVGTPWVVYFSLDDDYKVRWKRVGKSIDFLQKNI
jgi:signal peptidase I